jgi:hypothetical protein
VTTPLNAPVVTPWAHTDPEASVRAMTTSKTLLNNM